MSRQHVLFSDIDGTLAHYAEGLVQHGDRALVSDLYTFDHDVSQDHYTCRAKEGGAAESTVISLPISSTGLRAWMSVRAADMVARIRGDGGGGGAPFVMISGARTSTIIQRLPYLPTPDAVATENGGRLFFADAARKTCLPLREDLAWRARHDDMAGPATQEAKRPEDRAGPLWDLYRTLVQRGYKVDTASYSTCLRVSTGARTQAELERLLQSLPEGLISTVNLGKADIYPATSGKARVAHYLAQYYEVPLSACAFMCDDDNDIELARLVGKAYCPTVASESLRRAVHETPEQFSVAKAGFVFGTEECLDAICKDWGVPTEAAAPRAGLREAALS